MKTLILIALLFGWCPEKPKEMTCKDQALHNYYEKQYMKAFLMMNEGNEPDYSDSGVGCVDDCLEPLTTGGM